MVLCETDLSPAMIEAGECALAEYDHRFELPREAVIRIFLTMANTTRLPLSARATVRLATLPERLMRELEESQVGEER